MAPRKKKAAGTTVAKRRRRKGAEVLAGMSAAELAVATAGEGSEHIGQEELALPFIGLLQDLSPQVKKKNEMYIPGAEAGMFIETVSGAIWDGDEGMMVIPCHFQRHIIEWVKRTKGGGFVGIHPPDMIKARAACQDIDNHDLVDTHQQAVLVRLPNGSWTEAIFPMKSTALTPSRRWNTNISRMECEIDGETFPRAGDGPLARWWSIWKIQSAQTSNQKGEFFVPRVPTREIDLIDLEDGAAVIAQAKAFRALCEAGSARVDWQGSGDSSESDEERDPNAPGF